LSTHRGFYFDGEFRQGGERILFALDLHCRAALLLPQGAHEKEQPGQLASWVGACPGRQESAGISYSDRSAKGNPTMRRLLKQMAHATVKQNG
jgi:transposase